MKKIAFLFSILVLSSMSIHAQVDSSYSKFLIFKSQAIDYFPVWGKTDQEIYVNLMSEEWRKYDLSKCEYINGTYLTYDLAINTAENWKKVSDKSLIKQLEEDKKWAPRELKDKKGRVYSLEQNEYDTELYFKNTFGKKEKIMTIKGNAHSLAISPSGKLLACLFELSGLMVLDIEKEFQSAGKEEIALSKMSNIDKAEYYFKKKDQHGLEESLSKCNKEEKSTSSYGYYNGLILYIKSEQDSTLLESAEKSLLIAKDDSRFSDANLMLGYIYLYKKDMESMLKFADRSILLLPENSIGYYLKGEYYYDKGDKTKSCEYFRQAYERGDYQLEAILNVDCNK